MKIVALVLGVLIAVSGLIFLFSRYEIDMGDNDI
jgi:hypothetical protein